MFVLKKQIGFPDYPKMNNTLHLISQSIFRFRFDNPAGDCISNSNGKQSSYNPCRKCNNIVVNNEIQIKRYVF